MAGPKIFDRVKDTSTTTGTGTLTLANSAPTGFRTFGSVLSNSDTCFYAIASSGGSEWEVGIGTYTTSGTTLARTTVLASSNSGSAVNLSSGTKDVFIPSPADIFSDQNGLTNILNSVCQGRLTLESGVPISTSDQTAKTNVYFTPYLGNQVSLYVNGHWKIYSFSEITLALGTLSDATNYDVFLYDNAGTLTLESVAWTNDTTRATAITTQDGIYIKSGSTNKRYLGTFRTTATTTTEDSTAKRYLWNAYNRVDRSVKIYDSTTSWTIASSTWRGANNSSANRVSVVVGLAGWSLMDLTLWARTTTANNSAYDMSIAEDSVTAPGTLGISKTYVNSDTVQVMATIRVSKYPSLGYHYYQWLEASDNGVSITVQGVEDGPAGSDTAPASAAYGTWQS